LSTQIYSLFFDAAILFYYIYIMAALNTHDKALQINIDASRYGAFAEIGAGQEVARWFFHVGGAAGTVAKTISAYDMTVSDAIYGPAERYVSRQRLKAMLDYEYGLLVQRLGADRGQRSRLFAFADTVAAKSHSRREEGQGWLGIRFQAEPRGEPSEIILHARLWDSENVRQQEALGILGVNLTHGAFYSRGRAEDLIATLMDGLTRERMEVDMIKFDGPAFAGVDNRLMSLQLVQQRLTNAAMFAPGGEVLEPAELLYHKPVLIERGSFRPATKVTLDMLERSLRMLGKDRNVNEPEPVVLMEMTLRNLFAPGQETDHRDFLARVETLRALGKTVMISNYSRFHNVTAYLRRYTRERIGMALGIPTLAQLFNEDHYRDLGGGALEAVGRLFDGPMTLFVYPWKNPRTSEVVTAENFQVPAGFHHLYRFLLENRRIEAIAEYGEGELSILPAHVLDRLQRGDPSWEELVPQEVVRVIKQEKLFGYGTRA
jgi:hypothetical protein